MHSRTYSQGIKKMTSGKTIKELRTFAREKLGAIDADALIKSLLKCDEIYLTVNAEKLIDDALVRKYTNWVKRREMHECVAYITCEKEFMSLPFYVDESVLVPRSETELLVEEIINADIKKDTVLDLCTGSGAIAVSLAHYLNNTEVLGVDVSEDALNVAQKNAENILSNKNISFKKCDVLTSLASLNQKYDVVVSNPPYIESSVIPTLDADVRDFEPHIALDGGDDGLKFYRAIEKDIHHVLKKDGYLFLEIGFNQGDEVKGILSSRFCDIEVIKDYAGLSRIVKARFKG